MKETTPKKIALNPAALLVPFLLAVACSPFPDAYSILKQECKAGITTDVNGVPVATTEFMLVNGQKIVLGGSLGGQNTLTSKGNGDVTLEVTNPNSNPATYLSDGRIVVDEVKSIFSADKIAFTHTRSGNYTKIDVTMNCKNPTLVPPVVRAENGFSPSRNGSKPSPVAYKGFGHR